MRMIHLYDTAQANNGMVLSTDNLTEYYLGFWTICGDVGDYGMIQELWKTEVYELARYLCTTLDGYAKDALQECIDALPTDGLGISNSDLDQIGAKSYDEVDTILKAVIDGHTVKLNNPVIERYNRTHYKREIPISIPRGILTAGAGD